MAAATAEPRDWRVRVPDEVLLRRFGLIRAVGGAAYFVAVLVLFFIYGLRVWPLALGVPVLAVVTTGYFVKSAQYPRTAVVVSLVADALVLGGAIAFFGGTGSGLVMLYTIVVVSAGILLGPSSAAGFTGLCVALSFLQLLSEEMLFAPALLHRAELAERVPVLLVSLTGVVSVGYLTATYANRLHELVALAGAEVEVARQRGRRRRSFVRQAVVDVRQPLQQIEQVADELERRWDDIGEQDRMRLASKLRMDVTRLAAEVSQLADVGTMDSATETRPEPVQLQRVVNDCLHALEERLAAYEVVTDVEGLKVLGDRRGARRVVFNLLENVADHTAPGTRVEILGRSVGAHGVLMITDDGPGIPSSAARRLFDPPDEGGGPRVGLPLVAELCESMGAEVRYEPAPGGQGSRFLLSFRLAPRAAPSPDD